jgi:serine/threonine-protein kinase
MSAVDEGLIRALADRYRIEREIGGGGMSRVWLATETALDRQVVVKVIAPELREGLSAERFTREVKLAARLQQANIVPVLSAGTADGVPYYTMPFVTGESLRTRLTTGPPLTPAESVSILRDVARALAYAHGEGVVHRDIKPENVLLSHGAAMVTDFGIAKALTASRTQDGGAAVTLTQAGGSIGTPAYMAPEQAVGDTVDQRADLYAWGVLAYELLAGAHPFKQHVGAQKLITAHITESPVAITGIPIALGVLVMRCMEKSPSARPASAAELLAVLDNVSTPASSGTTVVPSPARRVPGRAVLILSAALFLVASGIGWALLRGRGGGLGLDPEVIAVLPFRVGGDPSIGYLRESMLDLLQARLTGIPRTVEPRTLLAAWRQAVGSEKEDLSEIASRTLARRLGAGRVLLGSAVATPTELTLSGSLIRVADGKVLAREQAAGAPDSIAVLVNRLTAALLIGESGEAQERSAGLAGAPLDALQDYLAGRKASRRGDYFGAMQLYGRAFARDSTFADAAFAMVTTNAWIGTVFATAGWQVVPLVARLRARLGARDLALFLALPMVGPNYPRPSTLAEVIAQAERAADAAADSPEQWLLLGQLLSRYGGAASRVDWAARSAEALDRAIALDSSFTLAISERLYTAMAARDSAATARYARLLEARVASGFTDDFYLWAAAHTLGDSAAARRWRDRTTGLGRTDVMQKLVKMTLHSVAFAVPLGDARWALDTLEREAHTVPERIGAGLGRLALRFAEGRTDLGDVNSGVPNGAQWGGTLIQQSLIEPAYRAMGATVVAQEAAGDYRMSAAGGAIRWPPMQDCFGALFRVAGGDSSGAAAAVRRLRAFAVSEPPPIPRDDWQQVDLRVCPLLLQAMLGDRPALERLDSLLREDPRGFSGSVNVAPAAFANFTVARLREAQGNLQAALAAIRRREVDYFPAYLWSLPAFLRQEGRLAALTGDTIGAIRSYDQYLTLRTNPDAPFKPQRDSVIAERAALARRIAR